MAKINIRNLYIDLLNKIKQSEGASKEYVDGQVAVIDQHLSTIDGDITAINSVIPETASATNQLITGDDITGSETFGPASSITIEDSEPFNLAACEVDIEPIQDLHGYNKPWVGGAEKNKLVYPYTDTTKTLNNVTFTDVGNGKITTQGTANARTVFSLHSVSDNYRPASGSYIVSKGFTSSYMAIVIDGYNGTTWAKSLGRSGSKDNVTINIDYNGYDRVVIYIEIASGIGTTGFEFSPMMRLSTVVDDSWLPYSNICLITGTSSVDITVTNGEETKTTIIDLDGIRYGVNINLKTGVMTVKYVIAEFDGSNDEDWTPSTQYSWNVYIRKNDAKTTIYNDTKDISNQLLRVTTQTEEARRGRFWISDAKNINVGIYDFVGSTLSNWRSYLASYPLQICYELATPITVQLTPVQIQLLTGTVTISASSGTIIITTTKLTGAVEDLTALVDDILPKLPASPTTDGSYNLTVTVTDGAPIYTWEVTT